MTEIATLLLQILGGDIAKEAGIHESQAGGFRAGN